MIFTLAKLDQRKEGRKIAQVKVSEQRHKSSVNLSGESRMSLSGVVNLDVLEKSERE